MPRLWAAPPFERRWRYRLSGTLPRRRPSREPAAAGVTTAPHALLLTAWLADLDIPAMGLLATLSGDDAAQGARLLLVRRYARRLGLAARHIEGANARRIEFAVYLRKHGGLSDA